MNPSEEAVAIAHFLRSRGFDPSDRSIARILRDQGLHFRESAIRDALRDASGTQKSLTRDASGTQTGIPLGPLFSPSDSPVSPPVTPSVVVPLRSTTRAAAQIKLELDGALKRRKGEILGAVWKRVQPFIGRGATRTGWCKRNSRIAREIAELGFSADGAVRAWEMASDDFGEPIRELGPVQRFIERAAHDRAQRQAARA